MSLQQLSLAQARQFSRRIAAQTIARRRTARRSLLHFTNHTYPQYEAEPAHALIAATLDKVVAGDITRLMIFAPPQHGKSELSSVRLPAYWLGKRPDDPVILTSYDAALAFSKSRQAREALESGDYAALFPKTTTDPVSRAVNEWNLKGKRGGMIAAGVGGPITGHGALLGIIDDPIKNWEDAQSETIRKKVGEWYKTTFRTRIWEGGAIVLIMTRWHESDLAGQLLLDQGEKWTVLRLPALAETQEVREANDKYLRLPIGRADPLGRKPGEPLCPNRFSQAALEELQHDVGAMAWAAEYQGVPRPAEGNRFKREWFRIVDAATERAQRARYWDNAATEGGGAFSAGVRMARVGGDYFVEDVMRGQWSTGQRRAIQVQTAELDAERYGNRVRIKVEQEPGSAGVDSIKATIAALSGFPVQADRVTGSKDVRLEPFAAQAEAGNVCLVRGPWNGAWLDEICAIPNGRYRDQADATAGAFQMLARRGGSMTVVEY